jgi:dTDP-glucose 4,6-dehydratase
MRLLITGGCGFVGSNLIRQLLAGSDATRVVNLDKLTYAGNPASVAACAGDPRYRFVHADIADGAVVARILREESIEVVLHLAAESHVDRSIAAPAVFIETNVAGTQVLLEASRAAGVRRFVQVSTDEVYGSLGPTGSFSEESPLAPSSPYSASKASADLLALAYARTYGMDVVVTRCSNNYGPFQLPEKLIPLTITRALQNLPIPVYGDGGNVRDWIHVDDHARGILAALERGEGGEVYNLGAQCEKRNLEVVHAILDVLGRPRSLVSFVRDRPGHDLRYAIDCAKARKELGWQSGRSWSTALADTVRWYVDNPHWCRDGVRRADTAASRAG